MAAGSLVAGKDIAPHWMEGMYLAAQRHIPDSLDGGEGQGQDFKLRSGTGGNRGATALRSHPGGISASSVPLLSTASSLEPSPTHNLVVTPPPSPVRCPELYHLPPIPFLWREEHQLPLRGQLRQVLGGVWEQELGQEWAQPCPTAPSVGQLWGDNSRALLRRLLVVGCAGYMRLIPGGKPLRQELRDRQGLVWCWDPARAAQSWGHV